jgi:hypothetical protein
MRKSSTELAKEISNFVNGARPAEVKQLAEQMSNDHPTLQQNTMGLVMEFIQKMAGKNYVDARNEASKEMAQAALEGIRQMWVKKFTDSGMAADKAELQAKACIENISLPFI